MGGLHEWLRQVACPACVAGIIWNPLMSFFLHAFFHDKSLGQFSNCVQDAMFSCVLIFPQTSSDHVRIRHLLIRNVTRSLGNNTRVTTCSFVTVARPMFVLCIGMSIARVSVLQA